MLSATGAKRQRVGLASAEIEVAQATAARLELTYPRGAAPPTWSFAMQKNGKLFDKYHKSATCYRTYGVSAWVALKLVSEREPLNMAMHSDGSGGYDANPYDLDMHKVNFGIDKSGYTKLFDEGGWKLPGNIAVYCKSPVDTPIAMHDVHVMNVIGLAFDDPKQPDAIFFEGHHSRMLKGNHDCASVMSDGGLLMHLWNHFVCMWDMAYRAALDKNLKAVCLARINGGAFGGCLPDIPLNNTTKLPHAALNNLLHRTLRDGKKWENLYEFIYQETTRVVATAPRYDGKLHTVYCNNEQHPAHAQLLSNWARTQRHHGHGDRVPACFHYIAEADDTYLGLKLDDILFLNAWDPHSIAGNGNGMDNSLDGFFGRSSAIGLICCPCTNPLMSHVGMPACSEYITADIPFIA
jgi:hypothetical protein